MQRSGSVQVGPQYFSSDVALNNHWRSRSRQMAFEGADQASAKRWQSKARRRLQQLLGLDHFTAAPAKPIKVESVPFEGLTRETWRIQTETGVWMPFYLFIPPQPTAKPLPLVLCPHGHSSSGKYATGGRRDIPEMIPIIDPHNYDYGVTIARAGFITACPDARGFGERREPALQGNPPSPAVVLTGSCYHLTLSGIPLGTPVQGMWTWELMRLVDHLSNDRRIDSARIGCAGLSGGGLQTLDLAAVDTRIKAAVVSGYFYGVRESLLVQNGNCMCNVVPHLWEDFDMGDIGALIAPRGLFIETGDNDPLNGKSKLANVRSQVRIAQKVFAALGSPGQLKHHIFHGEHRWDGGKAVPWLQQQLQ